MKTKTKIIISAAALLVACLLCVLGIFCFGKPDTKTNYSQEELLIKNAAAYDFEFAQTNTSKYPKNATVVGRDGIVAQSGDFVLSGNYYNGITIAAAADSDIKLWLNSANIYCTNQVAIAKSEEQINLNIICIDGTSNAITSQNGNAIHVNGSLKIYGKGALYLSSTSNAIKAKNDVAICNATLSASFSKHGIFAQNIATKNAKISLVGLQSSKDGLHTECDFDNSTNQLYQFTLTQGYISLVDTDLNSTTFGDGIQADSFVYISGGNYDVTTKAEFIPYANKTDDMDDDDFRYTFDGKSYSKISRDDIGDMSNTFAIKQSAKGIKVGEIEYDTDGDGIDDTTIFDNTHYQILLQDATLNFHCDDDAIHCNSGNTYVKSGTLNLTSLDDAITADLLVQIDGGDITIWAYEGIEGAKINITDGNITIYASDDGINASSDTQTDIDINISGGKITVFSQKDCIDSNNTCTVSGGELFLVGPETGLGSGAFDADGGLKFTGGSIIAISNPQSAQRPSITEHKFIIFTLSRETASDTPATIKDMDGNVLLVCPTTRYLEQTIIVASPIFKLGESYNIFDGETLLKKTTIFS